LAQAETITVPLPCSDASPVPPGLRACKDVVEGVPGKPGVLDQLRQRMLVQIDGNASQGGYYQNIDPDHYAEPVSASLAPRGKGTRGHYFGPAVCNLVPGELVNVIETRVDHTAEHKTCGQPTSLDFNVRSSPTSFSVSPAFRVGFDPDPGCAPGSLEDGYIKGALVAATQCFYVAIKNEIQAKHQVTVADVGGHPSACLALARDASAQSQQLTKALEGLRARFQGDPKNLADIVNCEKDRLEMGHLTGDQGGARQSAQQLCAARAALETVAVQLAACQVFHQASTAWTRALREKDGLDALGAYFRREVAVPCHNRCKADLNDRFDYFDRPDASQVKACAQRCYSGDLPAPGGRDDGKLAPAMRKYFEDLWPARPLAPDSRCSRSCSPSP
jgi:hypothetical protein